LLEQYIAAFENSDPALLERLLRTDATLEAVPTRTWFSGRATCLPFLVNHVMKEPGHWRMFPTSANGQPAAVAYWGGEPYGVTVLTPSSTGIARITSFGDPSLVGVFGFPATQE
jgi:RNA polymerase sigma-70 factor (ECF subfamily)